MTATNYEKALLAVLMWREARGEGSVGMQAVGCVVRNRVEDWHQSWRDVIVGHDQFSSMTILGDANTVLWPPVDVDLAVLAGSIADGSLTDCTGGAHYYANEAAIISEWYHSHIVADPAHAVTVQIGRHTFRK